ncbi:unnamed protein product [Rotaria sp. Silwood2]|nr:unnamed protein product [Rotaria sp. Silwood2]
MPNPEQIPGFRGISQRDSPIGYTKQSKWYTKIEIAQLYPTDTFSARFDVWIPSETANSGRNPGFPGISQRDSPMAYTKQSKRASWWTRKEKKFIRS